ncbi:hypothetical protein ACS0TY_008584 [Phlomoides rotata]
MAVVRGLELAIEHSVGELDVESDSHLVINALIKLGINLSYLGRCLRNIEDLATRIGDVAFSWSRRSVNCVAHKLALYAYLCDSPFFSFHVPL